jgi:hypothetical protein
MEKWFHLRIEGLVWWIEGWVFGFEELILGDWGACGRRKNCEKLSWETGSRNAMWGRYLRVGGWTLGCGSLTLGKMCMAQRTNPSQRERSDADPCRVLKGRSLGLVTLTHS